MRLCPIKKPGGPAPRRSSIKKPGGPEGARAGEESGGSLLQPCRTHKTYIVAPATISSPVAGGMHEKEQGPCIFLKHGGGDVCSKPMFAPSHAQGGQGSRLWYTEGAEKSGMKGSGLGSGAIFGLE